VAVPSEGVGHPCFGMRFCQLALSTCGVVAFHSAPMRGMISSMGRIREGWSGIIYLGVATSLIALLAVKCEFDSRQDRHLRDAQTALISAMSESVESCASNSSGGYDPHRVSGRREVLLWSAASNSEHPAANQLADKRWSGQGGQPPPIIVVISETREEVGSYTNGIRAFANTEHLCAIDGATGRIVARKAVESYRPESISLSGDSDYPEFDYIANADPERIADIAITMSGGR
jgi:hypothetical protein